MNKYKTLVLNTAVFAIGNLGSKLLAFLLNRLYTANFVGAAYNTKEVLQMSANLLIPVVSFSITEAVIRYGLDKEYDNRAVFTNAVTVLGMGIAGFILLSPLLLLYADIRPYAFMLVGYISISCFRQISTQFARARGFVKLFAADGIFCTLVFFLFNVIFIKFCNLGIYGFLLAMMGSDLISGTAVWLIARHGQYFSPKYLDKELLRKMLQFSIPLIPTAVLWIITGFSDRLFVRHMVSATEAGVYGLAAQIPNLISMASTIFYQAWNMSAIAEDKSEERSQFYAQVYEAYQALLTIAAGFIIALDQILSKLLIDPTKDAAYEHAYLYTPVLVIAVLIMCYNQFLSSIYTVTKHTKNSLYTSIIAAILNLFLNALLIPPLKVYGAIAATFLSYLVCYIIRIFDARRFIPFEVNHARFIVNLALLIIMCSSVERTAPNAMGNPIPPDMVPIVLALPLIALSVINFKPLLATAYKLLRKRK